MRCRVLKSFWQKAIGLMFSPRVREPLLFVFDSPGRHAIHSLFCPPFDAVYLDEDGRVVDKTSVRTTRFWITPKGDAKYLIETQPGLAKKLKEGQRVDVSEDGAWLEFG